MREIECMWRENDSNRLLLRIALSLSSSFTAPFPFPFLFSPPLSFSHIRQVDGEVFSYLNAITGQQAGDLDGAPPLHEVLVSVKALLGPDVILVGQSIDSDIKWLTLTHGEDFKRKVCTVLIHKSGPSRSKTPVPPSIPFHSLPPFSRPLGGPRGDIQDAQPPLQ